MAGQVFCGTLDCGVDRFHFSNASFWFIGYGDEG
jgi:hypothetical protein